MTIDPLKSAHNIGPLPVWEDETRYALFLVRLMRAVVALIVVGFIIGGISTGYAIAHTDDRSTEWTGGRCTSSLNDDGTCGYKPATGAVLGWSSVGGAAGLLGGLVATFGIETGIVVFLAARKYLRS
jgi:hypothetical protein